MKAFINAHIFTVEGEEFENGIIIVSKKGVISEIGVDIEIPVKAKIIDLGGKCVYPGFVDPHVHLGITQDLRSLEAEREFMDDYIMPQLRVIDSIDPTALGFGLAVKHGTTSVGVSPGSTYVIGGQMAVIKTSGIVVDEMVVHEPAALKMALGEMFCFRGLNRKPTPQSRMIVAARIREAFVEASNYGLDEESLDLAMDAIYRARRGRMPVFVHARKSNDIMTAVRLAKEFNLDLVIVNGEESDIVANYLRDNEVSVVISPATFGGGADYSEFDWGLASRLYEAGVNCVFATDHPIAAIDRLREIAVLAHEAGLPKDEALKSITIKAATILGVEDEVGSLEEGKDADFIVTDGHPLDIDTKFFATYIKGKKVYAKDEK